MMTMPKNANPKLEGFGKRLAELRKAAGYTQEQLAQAIGASRRMVAYYETESQHPPIHILIELANALSLSTDQLLGVTPTKNGAPHGNSHLVRRLKQLESLPSNDQKAIFKFIDALIAQRRVASVG
jgi:transcriptional regulator with XRE-family HTH domain